MAAKFSKKHYKEFAEMLAKSQDNNWTYRMLVDEFADYFAKDNGRFQRSTFFNACGLEY